MEDGSTLAMNVGADDNTSMASQILEANPSIGEQEANLLSELFQSFPQEAKGKVEVISSKNAPEAIQKALNGKRGAVLKDSLKIVLSENSDATTVAHEGFHIVYITNEQGRNGLVSAINETFADNKQKSKLREALKSNKQILGSKSVDSIMSTLSQITSENALDDNMAEATASLYEIWQSTANMGENEKLPSSLSRIFKELQNIFKKVYQKIKGKPLGNKISNAIGNMYSRNQQILFQDEINNRDFWQDAKERLDRLFSKDPLDISNDTTTAENAKEVYKSIGTVKNKETGMMVDFVNKSFGKISRHKGYDPRLIGSLERLFADSTYMNTEVPDFDTPRADGTVHKQKNNIKDFSNFINTLTLDGNDYIVRYTVQNLKTRDGKEGAHQFHSQQLTDIKISNFSNVSKLFAQAEDIVASDSKLADFMKAVKENTDYDLLFQDDIGEFEDEADYYWDAANDEIDSVESQSANDDESIDIAMKEPTVKNLRAVNRDFYKKTSYEQLSQSEMESFVSNDIYVPTEYLYGYSGDIISKEIKDRNYILKNFDNDSIAIIKNSTSIATMNKLLGSYYGNQFDPEMKRLSEKLYKYTHIKSQKQMKQEFIDRYASKSGIDSLKDILHKGYLFQGLKWQAEEEYINSIQRLFILKA